tara:strand:- start:2293 stop:3129 length:837 start_codon:yes stop_codon:yes gene_type:complete
MRARNFLLTFFIVVLLANPAGATTRDVKLFYKIYFGGFNVVDLTVDISLKSSAYKFTAKAESVGLIGRMFPWWMKAYSNGELSESKISPIVAGQRNNWRGQDRVVDLKFADGIATIDRILPEPESDGRDRVPIEMRSGVTDLTGAILGIIREMDNGKSCEAKMPVFDGRRSYDLVAKPDGRDNLQYSGYTPYVGETVTCRVTITKKAGFKKEDKSGWNDRERTARVWMAKTFAHVPPVPVRLTTDTPLGSVIAHLNAASVNSNGHKMRLKYPETTEKK